MEVENVLLKKVLMLKSKVEFFSNNYSIYLRGSVVASKQEATGKERGRRPVTCFSLSGSRVKIILEKDYVDLGRNVQLMK